MKVLYNEPIRYYKSDLYPTKDPIRVFGNAGIDVFIPFDTKEFIKALEEKNSSDAYEVIGEVETKDSIIYKEQYFNVNYGREIIIKPHKSILIPSGLHFNIPDHIALVVMNKSGVATKKGLDKGAELIDSSYEGVCHIHLINTTNSEVHINFGEKISQFTPIIINTGLLEESFDKSLDDFYRDHSKIRGAGGFGSTGNA